MHRATTFSLTTRAAAAADPVLAFYEPLFPLVGVGFGMRAAGLVAINARLEVLHARRRHLRHLGPHKARVEALCRRLQALIAQVRPGMVIVEVPRKRSWREGLGAVARLCDAHGVSVRLCSLDDALRLLRPDDAKGAVRELGRRYRELGQHLRTDPVRLFRDHDHLRSTRPLLGAFAVAHATALVSLGAARDLRLEAPASPFQPVAPGLQGLCHRGTMSSARHQESRRNDV